MPSNFISLIVGLATAAVQKGIFDVPSPPFRTTKSTKKVRVFIRGFIHYELKSVRLISEVLKTS